MSLILTILLFVLIFGIIILLHEGGHFLVARREGMKVREFAFGFPPRLWAKRIDGTQFSLNLLPLGGYVNILGEQEESEAKDSFTSKSPWARLRVILAGVTMNILLAWLLLILFFWVAPLAPQLDAVVVTAISPGSAAEQAGLKVNDFVLSAEGVEFTTEESLVEFTKAHRGQDVEFQIRRNGSVRTVTATLGTGEQPALGVSIIDAGEVPHVPWYQAPWLALQEMWHITLVTLAFIGGLVAKLFGGGAGVSVEQVSGPVGIFGVLRQVQILGLPAILHFSGLISLAVAIFNLLPFPALDGGHAVLLLYEGITGKRALKPELERWITATGFLLLLLLIAVITYFDIQKLI